MALPEKLERVKKKWVESFQVKFDRESWEIFKFYQAAKNVKEAIPQGLHVTQNLQPVMASSGRKPPRPTKMTSIVPTLQSTIAIAQYKHFLTNLPTLAPTWSRVHAPFTPIPTIVLNQMPVVPTSLPSGNPIAMMRAMLVGNSQSRSLSSGFANLYRYFTTSLDSN